jgi:hypothetical protein
LSAIPKPLNQRLPHAIKQEQRKGAIHGQQIISLQTAVGNLQTGLTVTAPTAAGSAYSEAQAASAVTAITQLITALQQAGIIS